MITDPNYQYTVHETLLNVDNVNVAYNGVSILRDVSFKLDNIVRPAPHTQGQVDALLAPSGMGKSQLFRVISGLKMPDSGNVVMNTTGTAQDAEVKSGMIGVVSQEYPLFNHRTVLDNLMIAASVKIKDGKQAKATCMSYLDQFQLADKAKNYPHQISGGQRQRIAILQQMVSCGHLLLMDEPFSGLDPLMKVKAQTMITDLAAADELNSIIVTTHDIESAVAIADTILLLGREHDVHGNPIAGANIRFQYNLIDMGITWRPDIHELPQFRELVHEINARFKEL